MENALEVEDSLQEAGVFKNGIDDRIAHKDSYNTIIDFQSLDGWWKLHKDDYTKAEWEGMVTYWYGTAANSPNAYQLAAFVQRRLSE